MKALTTSPSQASVERNEYSRTCIPTSFGAICLLLLGIPTMIACAFFGQDSGQHALIRAIIFTSCWIGSMVLTILAYFILAFINMMKDNGSDYPSYQWVMSLCIVIISFGVGMIASFMRFPPIILGAVTLCTFMFLFPIANWVLIRTCGEQDKEPAED